MRIVGLTGGISSGKSTVSNLFKAHGIPVVDADIVARNVLKKGTGGWRKVVVAFGDDILLDNGEVDRPKLGQIVFTNPDKRQLLNRLLAPYISSGIFVEVLKLWMKGCKIIVLDVPLLFEAKMDKWTKPIIVVWVDSHTQLERLMARDGTTEEEAKNKINAQMSLDLKRTKADIVIDNTGSLEDLKEHFSEVLIQVKKPLTWIEFGISRDGALLVGIDPKCARGGLIWKLEMFILLKTEAGLPITRSRPLESTEKCGPGSWSQRVQPGIDSFTSGWWSTFDIPCWKLCTLSVCPKKSSSEEKETSLQEENEEGKTEARRFSTRRINLR
ncbi:Dephospho-CoA kinase [Abeliophyllum distichum]|uniref:Dephospho-CoA kinase n=1 Tax=Abeliophyllum distichum TaxID=126358 RepID=A0ABD1QZ07_9LAMI